MSELENNTTVSVSVRPDGMIVTNFNLNDQVVVFTQNAAGAHRYACDLLDALAEVQSRDAK
ncbi:hypothetical protein [Acetobacter oryzoeni]|uniref:Uncharacterized protein n=1 Tax=Acetobacter oryzoeni TaxID=2500548 RepID=A0A5B9GJN6_9PROT|nr:hypothetical protein [Acetobacter oryzoeni]MCP1202271.1 hypothetical protein [Acetobacter oryzoeni]QEE85997.1 hypothetical protein EOV40_009955 [Acetobacter oryzoeni]